VGSAVNDAAREAGGALGAAVTGSVFSSAYLNRLTASSFHQLPPPAFAAARNSVAAALAIARRTPGSPRLTQDVVTSFMSGLHFACVIAARGLLGRRPGRLPPARAPQASTALGEQARH
jgi:hypothetical protein